MRNDYKYLYDPVQIPSVRSGRGVRQAGSNE